ncbi:zf-HC2 domain-containing protein [Nocardioides sp. YIM 152315]|uniref:anti-sigma factor family protein n=1 Tax=Nocardioides sp. YIM 152315 TaxID=3031760 RepID=UPI0023DAA850|nr:zf-HC2 domain-containing protein [Nocardioides sp. YIM 152315]MDF1603935.1 zf-HC2 domain-containing protein [Nocardioides sp. YIM 152315]
MMGPVGHLGPRISALLDGQLSPEETERAWAHVHQCHTCRDQVEREGWVKTRLAGLAYGGGEAPAGLKGSLLGSLSMVPGDAFLADDHSRRRQLGLVALGGGAVGAAFMGVLALGVAPADAPTIDRRAPATITQTRSPQTPATVTPDPTRTSAPLHRQQR